MPFTFDFHDDGVDRWSVTDGGAEVTRDSSYLPSLYVGAETAEQLATAREHLPAVTGVERVQSEEWREGFRHDAGPVIRVDVASLDRVRAVARTVHSWDHPGTYRLYNVDFAREFRYCLEEGIDPTPDRALRSLSVSVAEPELARDWISELTVGDETLQDSPSAILDRIEDRIRTSDPDVLLVSSASVIKQLFEQAERFDRPEFSLGRRAGYQQLAGRSTYTSYGRVGHSPARYNVPGRVLIDRSNTFMWSHTNLDGCLDLVRRSWRPLQETGWSSIGTILTSIQIREARERNVLVPWKPWRPEFFKTMRQLDTADRGGFTFAPDVGLHEDVHELDFSSLYPNIIVTRNISPETVRCECHDREDVPGLGYSICEKDGYLPEVLEPIISDRDEIKAELRETTDEHRRERLEGRSNAIKWILVSCFGYQGFSNAKYGRIECHESINAFAREIILDAKEVLEANGWQVVHGIVDSLWVTPASDQESVSLENLSRRITDEVGIRLEYESAYDWIAFVPQRNSDAGALTKYFGRKRDADEYKFRGIECRQRSTPPFIEDAQRAMIETLDATRDPEAVCETVREYETRLASGTVGSDQLVITQRISKPVDEYRRNTRNAVALRRSHQQGIEKQPGQSVEYVVADDASTTIDRVRLAHEPIDAYDTDVYRSLLVRAAASVLSPLGWRESRIKRYLSTTENASLTAY